MDFEKIIGHEDIIDNLRYMITNNKVANGILFEGTGGIGKKFTARTFAKSLLCQGEDSPCNECSSCLQFESSTNPDFLMVQETKSSIKKEEILDIIEFLSIKPFNSKYKVVIVEDFHKATPEAQNSLLKTLEEGPEYGVIILLSENNRNILETVLSRAKKYSFSPISIYKIVEYLMRNFNIDEKEAYFYANYSRGSIGRAIKFIEDEDFRTFRREYIGIFDMALKGRSDYVMENLKVFKNKDRLDEILDLYLIWIRDLLLFKKLGKGNYLYNIDYVDKLYSQTHLRTENLERIKNLLIDLKSNLKYNINKDLALDLFFINILEECKWQKQ